MALDVYVMPLWRFLVGDFHSPIEATIGLRPKILNLSGGAIEERPARVGWFGRWRARRQVAAIRRVVETANQGPAQWSDEGGVVYSAQSRGFALCKRTLGGLIAASSFRKFGRPPEGKSYDYHPVLAVRVDSPTCPHLVKHDCYCGYYLPCEFKRLVVVKPDARAVGSAPRLLRELDFVQSSLRVPDDDKYLPEDPLQEVKAAYLQLRNVADLSSRHGLPIIFWR